MDPIAGRKSGDLFYGFIKIERRDVEKVGILLHLLVFSKLLLDELLELCGYHVFRTFKINALFVGRQYFLGYPSHDRFGQGGEHLRF
ncbi:hypothetical protein D9M69_549570 [compost metagenome]